MSTSDDRRKHLLKISFIYILIVLFCVIFGAVYEKFSHGVYSYKMIYAFTAPMVLGTIFLLAIALYAVTLPGTCSLVLWNFGIAFLTTGLLFHGVLDIYGTTSKWIWTYYIIAVILLLSGIISYIYYDTKKPVSTLEDNDETADR